MGIDGGCFEQIEPLLKNDLLPNFKRLIQNGVFGKLKVTIPASTIPSWPCSFSGITPDDLGFYWFSEPNKGMFSSKVWRERAIFSIKNIKHFVLNVPGTYPAWPINGEMICGMMSPTLSTFPPELKFSFNNWILDEKTVIDCFKAFKMRTNLFLRKLGGEFELLTYVIRLPDHISHLSRTSINGTFDYISSAYLKIDKFLGTLIKQHYFDNLFIFSDHGLTRFKEGFNLRRWLEKKGLLYLNAPKKEKYLRFIFSIFDRTKPFVNVGKIRFFYKYVTLIQNKIFKKRTIAKSEEQGKSIISFRSGNVGALYLRGPDKNLRESIKIELLNEPSVKQIIEPVGEDVPDFFIILQDHLFFDHHPSLVIKRKRRTIGHKEYGIFLAYGTNIRKNLKLDIVNYLNIAPTLLKACDQKPLEHMKGTTLNIFDD